MRLLPTDNFRSISAVARFLLTAAILLGVDLWTKSIAFDRLAIAAPDGRITSRTYPFIPGWIDFTVTKNYGAVFGIGVGQRALFVLVSATAIVFLFYLFAWSGRQRFYQFILGMLMAGVLGNLYDRLMFGYVRDMIKGLPQWPNLFPWIFNVADSLLCTGVGLMLIYTLFFQPQQSKAQPADGGQPGEAKA